jgi:hypothetical protein
MWNGGPLNNSFTSEIAANLRPRNVWVDWLHRKAPRRLNQIEHRISNRKTVLRRSTQTVYFSQKIIPKLGSFGALRKTPRGA